MEDIGWLDIARLRGMDVHVSMRDGIPGEAAQDTE
jgi:hypothetical protein